MPPFFLKRRNIRKLNRKMYTKIYKGHSSPTSLDRKNGRSKGHQLCSSSSEVVATASSTPTLLLLPSFSKSPNVVLKLRTRPPSPLPFGGPEGLRAYKSHKSSGAAPCSEPTWVASVSLVDRCRNPAFHGIPGNFS